MANGSHPLDLSVDRRGHAASLWCRLHRHGAVSRDPEDALLHLGMQEDTYGWNLEMQMRAAGAGLRILELPVAHRRRAGGQSKVSGNLRGTLKASWRVLAAFLRIAVERTHDGQVALPLPERPLR